jgi:thiol-disulfide isomerase/thioredoxin
MRPFAVNALTDKKMASLAAVALATMVLGCSGTPNPSTPEGGSSAKSAQSTITAPPVEAQPTKSGAKPKSGNVSVQLVTPEEFKKIVAAQKGKVVLVDFWATWCGPCREKFPQTLALAKKFASQGLTAISVSMDSPDPKDQEKVLQFLEQENSQIINLSNKMEDSEAAFGAFDIDGGALPHYKLFDRKGNVRQKFGGDPDHPFKEADIEKAVAAALEEK